MIVAVVQAVELENGLVRLTAQPDNRGHLQIVSPFDFADYPRRAHTREVRCCGGINVEDGVLVMLEVCRCDIGNRLAFDGAPDDRRLMLSRRDECDFARLHDRRDAHRDRFSWNIVLAKEIRCGIAARDRVESNRARSRVDSRPWLIEPDVSRLADS